MCIVCICFVICILDVDLSAVSRLPSVALSQSLPCDLFRFLVGVRATMLYLRCGLLCLHTAVVVVVERLRQRRYHLHVRLREVAGATVHAALEPVVVHAVQQGDDVVLLGVGVD